MLSLRGCDLTCILSSFSLLLTSLETLAVSEFYTTHSKCPLVVPVFNHFILTYKKNDITDISVFTGCIYLALYKFCYLTFKHIYSGINFCIIPSFVFPTFSFFQNIFHNNTFLHPFCKRLLNRVFDSSEIFTQARYSETQNLVIQETKPNAPKSCLLPLI